MQNLTRALLDAHVAAGRGGALAVREPGRSWSYARLLEEVERCAAAMVARGIRPGDRVVLLLQDSIDFVAVLLGAIRVGALPVPLSMVARPGDVRRIVGHARPTLAVVHADLLYLLDEVRDELPAPPDILALPRPTPNESETIGPSVMLGATEARIAPFDGAGAALLLYTSGAGGEARGVLHTADAIRAAHRSFGDPILRAQPGELILSTSGLYSVFGVTCGLLFPLLAGGAACVLPGRARPVAVFDAIANLQPTMLAATPSLWLQMLNDWQEVTAPRPAHFRGVHAAISGAEPLPAKLWWRVQEGFDLPLLHGFGSTESLGPCFSFRHGESRPGSSGRLVEGFEARILDEAGKQVGAEEIGMLSLRGPAIARSYFAGHHSEKAAAPVAVLDGDGWLVTGDRFFVDREGWYFHCGRVDDRFRVSGKYVAPKEVEDTLLSHPAVWECAVVGREDHDGLLIPVAYVVPNVDREPSQDLGHELIEFVKRSIAPYKYPRRVEFVAELPKNDRGEVQRWRLGR